MKMQEIIRDMGIIVVGRGSGKTPPIIQCVNQIPVLIMTKPEIILHKNDQNFDKNDSLSK